jgi:uncharacterized protein YecE (DUF72 family)
LATNHPHSIKPDLPQVEIQAEPGRTRFSGVVPSTDQVTVAWERTAHIAQTLGAKVVLFQCPASFTAERENLLHLTLFFSNINREGLQLAWEPRGAWPLGLVAKICEDLKLLHCVDPINVDVSQINTHYWRLHGKDGYSYRYLEEDLVKLAELVHRCGERGNGPQYILFNNIWMKENARRFQVHLQRAMDERTAKRI